MNKFSKKAVSIALSVTTVVWLSGAAMIMPVAAQTSTADIQAQITALLAQIQTLQTQLGILGGSTGATACSFARSLTLGAKGDDVTCLQTYLISQSAANWPTGQAATGYFGPITQASVAAWQAANAVAPAVGYFGTISRAKYTSIAGTGTGTGTGTSTGTGTGATTVAAGLNVTLATDNPVATILLSDDTTGAMQNAAPVLKLTFTNGDATAQQINTIKLTRGGVSVDADVNNLYLYEDTTKIAELSGSSNKVFTFNNSAGLFTVPANGTKSIWVGINVATGITGTKTIGFSINSVSDIVLAVASTVNGTFPISGNQSSIAAITDLGYINLTNTATFPATIDPSSTSAELWRFTATANSQKMAVKKIVLTMVGTIANGDITDLMLTVGGAQVGATEQIGTDNKVVFDLSATPYEITSGQNKVFVLMGKVIKGTGRAFKFTVRSTADLVSRDTNYSVDTTPLNAGAALTVVDPDAAGDGTNINNGTLTVSRSADSPSGNVAAGMIDQALARFDYKANGEDVKVSYVRVSVNEETSDQVLDNGKLYFNGSQVGTTDVAVADETTVVYSLGNTVVIPAGTTGVFEYRADTTQGGGTALVAGQTIVVSLIAGTTDATGQTSLTNIATSASAGQLLTAQTGALSRAKNTSMADASTVTPTGVVGAVGVKVGSLILTAGSGEAVNLTQIVVGDDPGVATSNFGANFQNLTLKNSSGAVIAPVKGTLSITAGVDYTFSLTPSVTIAAGAQYVIDIYADILTGAAGYAAAEPGLEFVSASATGASTSNDATTGLTVVDLHNVVISANGSLIITADASTPVAGQLVMGETDQTFAVLSFTAGSPEDVNVSVVTITDTTSFGGSLSNIKLYDGTNILGTIASLDAQTNGVATFNLASNWSIPRNTTKVLTVKGTVNAYGSAVSGGSHTLNLASNADVTTRGAQSGVAITETVSGATGTAQTVYRTRAVVDRASTSPSGTQTAGAGASVLEFNVVASPYYDVVVNTVALTIAGSVDTTSTGNANLYKDTDLVTALATETYRTTACTAGTTNLTVASTTGIPVGANVRVISNGGATTVTRKVTAVTAATTLTVDTAVTACTAANDSVTYRPLQPGTGKLFFGAQTTITDATVVTGATTLNLTSTDGFSVGDTITVQGYTSTGVEVASTAGGVIATIPNATSVTVSAITLAGTITSAYLSGTPANAITNNQNSVAIAYTGLINTTGQVVGAGTTKKFIVKGDTTGATTTETLRVDIAAVGDLNWDDYTNYGITTVTKNLPILGGTLSY